MYALYWKPMNWNSIAPASRKKGQLVADTGPKSKPLVSPAVLAAWLS